MDKNTLKAAFHLGAIDAGKDVMQQDHYDRLIADLRKQQEGETEIAERLSDNANGWDQ